MTQEEIIVINFEKTPSHLRLFLRSHDAYHWLGLQYKDLHYPDEVAQRWLTLRCGGQVTKWMKE